MLSFTLFTYLYLKINVHRKDKVTFSVLSLNPPEVTFYTHVRTDFDFGIATSMVRTAINSWHLYPGTYWVLTYHVCTKTISMLCFISSVSISSIAENVFKNELTFCM